jgi:predicted nucleotidyltransferase
MNQTVKTELDKIVTTLTDTGIVTKIILFGSYARGEETPKSDIDLCVLTPVEDKHPIDLITDFWKTFIKNGLGVMDSYHLAAAEAAGADVLITVDKDFERISTNKKLSRVIVINPLKFK